MQKIRSFILSLIFFSSLASAAIEMPTFFSDGMVLQRETGAKLWGTANAGERVTVHFAGHSKSVDADQDGRWSVMLEDLQASKAGRVLTVEAGDDKKEIKDVLVGEVWLASGQSNMEWTVNKTSSRSSIKTDMDDLLRVYVAGNVTSREPAVDFAGAWKSTQPENTGGFTAVGYEFAKYLREKLDVPVGIFECAWGGKRLDLFLDGPIYRGMIAPLEGYGLRGFLWYQGESDTGRSPESYGENLEKLIRDWREKWGSDLSFYYVQLASYRGSQGPRTSGWTMVQDEMRRVLDSMDSEPGHVGMAVANDIGESNIHPRNKKDVGQRLARWALNRDYGMEDIVASGPLYESYEIQEDRMVVEFSYAEGLQSRDGGPLGGFEISGADGRWKPAEAIIEGNTVVLKNEAIREPKYARYAWEPNPSEANLVNGAGLPTSCFSAPSGEIDEVLPPMWVPEPVALDVVANAQTKILTNFTEDNLAEAGFRNGSRGGGKWSLNTTDDRVEYQGTRNSSQAGLYSEVISSKEGFEVEVRFLNAGSRSLRIGLVDSAAGTRDVTHPTKKHYSLYFGGGGKDSESFAFRSDDSTTTLAKDTQTYAFKTFTILRFSVKASGDWTYSLNGNTAATGTIAGGFDTSRSYRLVAYLAMTGNGSNGTYVSAVNVAAVPPVSEP